MKRTHQPPAPLVLAAVAAAATLALAACNGGSGPPRVASLGATTTLGTHSGNTGSRDGTSGTTLPAGNPTQLLNEWGACMRSHGDPDQVDPTVTANKVIDITWNPATTGGIYGTYKGGQGDVGPGQYCRSYLDAAQTALRGGQSAARLDVTQLVKYSQCMRANGVPDYPDPTGDGLSIPMGATGDLSLSNPTYQSATKLCARRVGVPDFGSGQPQPGTIELNGAGPGLSGD